MPNHRLDLFDMATLEMVGTSDLKTKQGRRRPRQPSILYWHLPVDVLSYSVSSLFRLVSQVAVLDHLDEKCRVYVAAIQNEGLQHW